MKFFPVWIGILALLRPCLSRQSPAYRSALSPVNQFFDGVFMVNLNSRPDRLFMMQTSLSRLNITFERVEGLDCMSREFEEKFGKSVLRFDQSKGVLAVCDSMRKIILSALNRGYKNFLFLEDDGVFHKNFNQEFSDALRHLPDDWSLFLIGSISTGKEQDYIGGKVYKYSGSYGSHGLGVNRRAFKPYLDFIHYRKTAIDLIVSELCRLPEQHCYVVYPALIITGTSPSNLVRSQRVLSYLGPGLLFADPRVKLYAEFIEDYDFSFLESSLTVVFDFGINVDLNVVQQNIKIFESQNIPMIEFVILNRGMRRNLKRRIQSYPRVSVLNFRTDGLISKLVNIFERAFRCIFEKYKGKMVLFTTGVVFDGKNDLNQLLKTVFKGRDCVVYKNAVLMKKTNATLAKVRTSLHLENLKSIKC